MNVIRGVGVDGFSAVLYGNKSQHELEYFRNEYNNAMALQVVGDAGNSFLKATKENYDRFNSDAALKLTRTANQHVKTLFAPEVIKHLNTLESLQSASRTMQRWVIANPVMRSLYNKQSCDGYSETYVDNYPGTVGIEHYDYRRVTNGVLVQDGDEYVTRKYYEALATEEDNLCSTDKATILSTWAIMEMYLKETKEDPTSPYGASL